MSEQLVICKVLTRTNDVKEYVPLSQSEWAEIDLFVDGTHSNDWLRVQLAKALEVTRARDAQIEHLKEQLEEAKRDGERLDRLETLLCVCRALRSMVPDRPLAITWEQGVEILNRVQDNLCPAIDQAIKDTARQNDTSENGKAK